MPAASHIISYLTGMQWAWLGIGIAIWWRLGVLGYHVRRLADHHERWPAPVSDEPPATDPSQTP